MVREIVRPHVLNVLPDGWMCDEPHFYVNPTGRFVIGGPDGDTGLTGRKDHRRHLWRLVAPWRRRIFRQGPDQGRPVGAYAARYLAKNVVAAGARERCTIQVAYAIGVPSRCRSISTPPAPARSTKTGSRRSCKELMDLSPRGIRTHLGLNRPIYARTAAYGHFGRSAGGGWRLSRWERLDLVDALKAASEQAAPQRWLYGRRRGRSSGPASARSSSSGSPASSSPCRRMASSTRGSSFAPRSTRSGWRSASVPASISPPRRSPTARRPDRLRSVSRTAASPGLARPSAWPRQSPPVHDDARVLLQALPADCLARAFILFPDPCPSSATTSAAWSQTPPSMRSPRRSATARSSGSRPTMRNYLDWMLERATRHPAFAWLAADRRIGGAGRPTGRRRATSRRRSPPVVVRRSCGSPGRPRDAAPLLDPSALRLARNDYIAQKKSHSPGRDGEFDGGPAAHFFGLFTSLPRCLACTRDVNAGVPGSVQQHRDGHAPDRDDDPPSLEAMGYRVVRVAMTGGRRATLQVMAERVDDQAMTVDDCASISHTVSALLDVADPITGAYQLEISSPGIDRPLVRADDYRRFAGFEAQLELDEPQDGQRRFRGRLMV